MKIRTKMNISLNLLNTTIILLIVIISYNNFKKSSYSSKLEQLDSITIAVNKAISEKMDNYFNKLEFASNMFHFSKKVNDDIKYKIDILENLRKQAKVNDSYFALPDGRTFTAINNGQLPNFNAKNLKREWFTRIVNDKEQRVVTTPYVSAQGQHIMGLGVPIKEKDNIIGTMNFNIPLDEITKYTQSIFDFENIYLTRDDGYLMASKTQEEIGLNLWDLIPSLKKYNEIKNKSRINFTLNNEEYIGSYINIDGLNWRVWAFEKTEIINHDSFENLKFNIFLFFIFLVFSSIIVSFLINMFINRVITISSSLEDISEVNGDLTKTIPEDGKDEISFLAIKFNTFISKLKIIIFNIKSSSIENSKISGSLNQSTSEAVSASIEIKKNSNSIKGQINKLNNNINETSSGVYQIKTNISNFRNQINEQVSAVEESSASIEEMIVSLENVSKITARKLESTKRLVATTKNGESILNQTSHSFKEGVSDKIDDIKDMIDIIKNISERTNLLAMNAAIEAAHAGDAGKGFAVVADEIRKMAEEAANSSTSISQIINIIISAINETDNNIDDTSNAFKSIYSEVEEIDTALKEISENTIELSTGGNEILQSVALLNNTTSNISIGIEEIESGAEDIKMAIEEVNIISTEVNSGVNEITTSINEVSDSFEDVAKLANKLGFETDKLNEQVNKFII